MFKNLASKKQVHDIIGKMELSERIELFEAFQLVNDVHGLDMQQEYIMRVLRDYIPIPVV